MAEVAESRFERAGLWTRRGLDRRSPRHRQTIAYCHRAPRGPNQIDDVIGLTAPFNIPCAGGQADQNLAPWPKENDIEKGKLAIASGDGFSAYPAGQ